MLAFTLRLVNVLKDVHVLKKFQSVPRFEASAADITA